MKAFVTIKALYSFNKSIKFFVFIIILRWSTWDYYNYAYRIFHPLSECCLLA
uniref:Uncharacterized protein n=1 Tax=Siphoviridae sp. ctWdm1 TaxID=2827883 RepID=A0A8S5RXS2_9CAUD|nr:MAG TPA: hypothetical protein [Siphoviridae sp. ctWdm1]